MKQQCLLRLNFSPDLEEDVVDFLLASEEVSSFQSFPIRGHGQIGAMTTAEQVEGRRKRVQFELVLFEDQYELLLQKLKEALPVADSFYCVVPILTSGHLLDSN